MFSVPQCRRWQEKGKGMLVFFRRSRTRNRGSRKTLPRFSFRPPYFLAFSRCQVYGCPCSCLYPSCRQACALAPGFWWYHVVTKNTGIWCIETHVVAVPLPLCLVPLLLSGLVFFGLGGGWGAHRTLSRQTAPLRRGWWL